MRLIPYAIPDIKNAAKNTSKIASRNVQIPAENSTENKRLIANSAIFPFNLSSSTSIIVYACKKLAEDAD